MNLLADTASQNVGFIDWEAYIPLIFTRFLRSFNLPVCYKNRKSICNENLWSSSIAREFKMMCRMAASLKANSALCPVCQIQNYELYFMN